MKKLSIILIFLLLLTAIGCESQNDASELAEVPVRAEAKPVIPFNERKFIYTNGIEIEYKEVNVNENNVKEIHSYPVISGLKDKAVQDKINNELETTARKLLSQIEADFKLEERAEELKVSNKHATAYIAYNYNNVIFVEYYARSEVYFPKTKRDYGDYKINYYGYDLNTGDIIRLDDLFKPGAEYKSKINSFICQYIIENNYDDIKYERMTKPFQGIREDQSFTFDLDGLRIIIDEKNDEFIDYGHPEHIIIPLNYLGDDLYIFDRYFDENVNIYEKEKLTKKLLPNQLEFKANNKIEEANEKYYINIINGEFINVPNKEIEKKLNEMAVLSYDVEGFKKKALTADKDDGHPMFQHHIIMYLNSGGYLSMAVSDDIYFENRLEERTKPFNYDFNLDKEMRIEDIFVDGTDIRSVIKSYLMKSYLKKTDYSIDEKMIEEGVETALKDNIFNFNESGIRIYFSLNGAKLEDYENWVWIPFDKFGIENIKILN